MWKMECILLVLSEGQLCGLPSVWQTEGHGWQSLYKNASQTFVYISSTAWKWNAHFQSPYTPFTVVKSSMRLKRLILIQFSVILSLELPTVLLCLGLQNSPGLRSFSLGQPGVVGQSESRTGDWGVQFLKYWSNFGMVPGVRRNSRVTGKFFFGQSGD